MSDVGGAIDVDVVELLVVEDVVVVDVVDVVDVVEVGGVDVVTVDAIDPMVDGAALVDTELAPPVEHAASSNATTIVAPTRRCTRRAFTRARARVRATRRGT
jgi:hypothetical protein